MLLYADSYRSAAVGIQRDTQQFSSNENVRGRSPLAAGIFYFSGNQLIVQTLAEQQIACSCRCFGIEFHCHHGGKRDFRRLRNSDLRARCGARLRILPVLRTQNIAMARRLRQQAGVIRLAPGNVRLKALIVDAD